MLITVSGIETEYEVGDNADTGVLTEDYMVIILNEDNTASVSSQTDTSNSTMTGTWAEGSSSNEIVITLDGDNQTYTVTVSGGKITMIEASTDAEFKIILRKN